MIQLRGLTLNNFLSYETANINFEDSGLYLIQGLNKDTNDSNESGKSTIPSAICWCFFGRTVKGLTSDAVIHWDHGKDCFATVRLEVDGKPVDITRYRKYKDIGDSLSVTFKHSGTNDVHEGKPTEIQPLVNNLLGFDYEAFVNTTIYSQQTSHMLGSATDAQRRAVFSKLLNLSRFDRAFEAAKVKHKEADANVDNTRNKIGALLSRLDQLNEDLKEAEDSENGYDDEQKEKIDQLKTNLQAVPGKIRLKALRRKTADVESQLNELNPKEVENEAFELHSTLATLVSKIDGEEKDLASIEDKCPRCKRPFTKKQVELDRKAAKSRLENTRASYKETKASYDTLLTTVDEVKLLQAELAELSTKIQDAEIHNEKVDVHVTSLEREIKNLEKQENPYTEHKTALKKKAKAVTTAAEQLNEELQDLVQKALLLQAATDLLGKKGIPSYIMENSFGFIEDKANEYLMILTGGQIRIMLDPERELVSGGKKEEITLRILKDEKEITYNHLSDGARQRTNIALLFAINAYCRSQGNFDFLLLDEVLDLSLDATGQEKVMELLASLTKEVGAIFVISHKQELADNFESVLKVEYEDGVSKII